MVGWIEFTTKAPKVIDREEADIDSRSINNCLVLRVVKLLIVSKGVDAEGLACLKVDNIWNKLVYQEFKSLCILYQMIVVVGL